MGIFKDLNLLIDVSGWCSDQGPLICESIVHFYDFVDVIELVHTTEFAYVPACYNTDCWFSQGYVRFWDGLPFFCLQVVSVVLSWAFLSLSLATNEVDAVVGKDHRAMFFGSGDGTSVAGFSLSDFVEIGIDFIFCCPAVDSVYFATGCDDAFGVTWEMPFIVKLSLLIVFLSYCVNFTCISKWIVGKLIGSRNAVVDDGFGFIYILVEEVGSVDERGIVDG